MDIWGGNISGPTLGLPCFWKLQFSEQGYPPCSDHHGPLGMQRVVDQL